MALIERKIITKIKKYINTPDVIVLHGARQVGKTSIMKYLLEDLSDQKKKVLYIDLEDSRFLTLLNFGVEQFIGYLKERDYFAEENQKKLYLFIDEVQYLSNPANFLKLIHDHYGGSIKLFVSGSSSFEIKSKFKESLVGRILNFEIYPLDFEEILYFKGYRVKLGEGQLTGLTNTELSTLYKEYILYGGYPRIVLEQKRADKEMYLQQIIDTYIRKDIRDLAAIKDIMKFNKLLEVLASQSGNLLNVSELANTARLTRVTVDHYLFLMENTYILKLLNPFSGNLRAELFKTPKVYFYDTGIAQLLWLKGFQKTVLGNMFETSVFAELMKRGECAELYYWRTQDKKEIDFIVRRGRTLIPIEAKVAQSNFNYTAMKYFIEKYKNRHGKCVTLDISNRKHKNVEFVYPWEIDL